MLNKLKFLCLGLITFGIFGTAQATLIDDEITITVTRNTLTCGTQDVTVGPGVEVDGMDGGALDAGCILIPSESIDIDATSIDIVLDSSTFWSNSIWEFTGLNWVDFPLGEIVGVDLTLPDEFTDNGGTMATHTANSVTLVIDGTSVNEPRTYSLALQVDHGNVPAPGTVVLIGLGLAGLGFARKRKA